MKGVTALGRWKRGEEGRKEREYGDVSSHTKSSKEVGKKERKKEIKKVSALVCN